jgi:hypothetical protein
MTDAPDLVDRLAARRRAWAQRHPIAARRLVVAARIWSWLSLAIVLVSVCVPATHAGVAAWLAGLYPLVQVVLVGRTRSVAVVSCLRWVSVGLVGFVAVVLVQHALLLATGMSVDDAVAAVWLAPGSEEALKLVPLLLWAWAARRRVAAWGVVDWITVGMALGTGAEVGEAVARRVGYAMQPGVSGLAYAQYYPGLDWLSWLPDQFDRSALDMVFTSPSHGVATALVAGALGWGLHSGATGLRRWLPTISAAWWGWMVHTNLNIEARGYDPGPLLSAQRFVGRMLGAGHELRWVLAAALVAALLHDAQRLRRNAAAVRPLPVADVTDRVERAVGRLVDGTRAGAGAVAALVRTAAVAAVTLAAETLTVIVGALTGRWVAAAQWTARRRRAAFAADARAPGPAVRAGWVVAAVGCAVAVLGLALVGPETAGGAFFLGTLRGLGEWWDGLSWWQQGLVAVGAAGLLAYGGLVFGVPALGLGTAATVAGGVTTALDYADVAADLIEDPRGTAQRALRDLTPSDVAIAMGQFWLSRIPFARMFPWMRGAHDVFDEGVEAFDDDIARGPRDAIHEAPGPFEDLAEPSVTRQLRQLTGTARRARWVTSRQGVEGPGLRDHFQRHLEVGARTAREYDLSARLTIQHGRRFRYRDPGSNELRAGYWRDGLFTATSETRGTPAILSHYRVDEDYVLALPGFAWDS